jgi:hypothetical protein
MSASIPLPRRASTTARPTAGAVECPSTAPAFFETCDRSLFPFWGEGRREGHTGGGVAGRDQCAPQFNFR